jgi:hypothetical protein
MFRWLRRAIIPGFGWDIFLLDRHALMPEALQ